MATETTFPLGLEPSGVESGIEEGGSKGPSRGIRKRIPIHFPGDVPGGSPADHPNEMVGGGGYVSVADEFVRAIDHDRPGSVVIDSPNRFARNGSVSTTTHHLVGVVGQATSQDRFR